MSPRKSKRQASQAAESVLNETVVLDGEMQYGTLVTALGRVVNHGDSYLEITFLGLTVRVYPSRVRLDRRDKLNLFASFMVALAEEVDGPPTRFAFCQQVGELEMGVMKGDGTWVFMPVEIIRFDRTAVNDKASATIPSADGKARVNALEFRRIRL